MIRSSESDVNFIFSQSESKFNCRFLIVSISLFVISNMLEKLIRTLFYLQYLSLQPYLRRIGFLFIAEQILYHFIMDGQPMRITLLFRINNFSSIDNLLSFFLQNFKSHITSPLSFRTRLINFFASLMLLSADRRSP